MKKLSIIIVTYNSENQIGSCLEGVSELSRNGTETICIDNASTDETRKIITSYQNVRLIKNLKNRGFSAACNQGIKESGKDILLFLNPDAFAMPGSIERLVRALDNAPEDIAGAGPKLIRSAKGPLGERVIDSVGMVLSPKDLSPYDKGQGEYDFGQYDKQDDYFGPSGACAAFRRSHLENIALEGEVFDEDFFAYYEDVDLAWRAGNYGYSFLFVPKSLVVHDRKNPQSKPTAIYARAFVNRYFCAIKNHSNLKSYFPKRMLYETARLFYKTMTIPGFAVANKIFFENLMKMVEKRKLVKEKAKASFINKDFK